MEILTRRILSSADREMKVQWAFSLANVFLQNKSFLKRVTLGTKFNLVMLWTIR